jgi:hypothetical protein
MPTSFTMNSSACVALPYLGLTFAQISPRRPDHQQERVLEGT